MQGTVLEGDERRPSRCLVFWGVLSDFYLFLADKSHH